ncbi:hypothetical protein Nepgr_032636 [Nepenthes gracilis]|uniref:Uncharacterized protein n=1 Tax=Nepenthes gracilis TaxID=150966 RepID=A0AAD3Y676_NEPGR|nr:hypothetical protein Nepgr_032636 [Nepenthes gracilis]
MANPECNDFVMLNLELKNHPNIIVVCNILMELVALVPNCTCPTKAIGNWFWPLTKFAPLAERSDTGWVFGASGFLILKSAASKRRLLCSSTSPPASSSSSSGIRFTSSACPFSLLLVSLSLLRFLPLVTWLLSRASLSLMGNVLIRLYPGSTVESSLISEAVYLTMLLASLLSEGGLLGRMQALPPCCFAVPWVVESTALVLLSGCAAIRLCICALIVLSSDAPVPLWWNASGALSDWLVDGIAESVSLNLADAVFHSKGVMLLSGDAAGQWGSVAVVVCSFVKPGSRMSCQCELLIFQLIRHCLSLP